MDRSRKVIVAALAALTIVMAAGCTSSSEPVVAPAVDEIETPVAAPATPAPETPTPQTPVPETPTPETPEPATPTEQPAIDESTTVPAPPPEETTAVTAPTSEPEPQPEPEAEEEDVPETQEPSTALDPNRPATRLVQDPYCVVGIVAPDTLNLRAGPSTGNAIVAMLDPDECGIYLYGDEADGWVDVVVDRDDGEIRGWVSTTYIAVELAPVDPNAATVVITFDVEYGLETSSSEQPLDAFRLRSDGLVIGFLDANGQITVPADLDMSRTLLGAEFADDALCAWTGRPQPVGADNRYSAFLMALCA